MTQTSDDKVKKAGLVFRIFDKLLIINMLMLKYAEMNF